MTQQLVDALDTCLAQIEAGREPTDVLGAQPRELRAELAGLVEAATSIRALPPRAPRAAFRASVQAELAALEAARRAGRTRPSARWAPHWAPRWAVLLGALAVMVVAGTVYAAAHSRPGDRLHPLRHLLFGAPGDAGGSRGGVDRPAVGTGGSPEASPSTPVARHRASAPRLKLTAAALAARAATAAPPTEAPRAASPVLPAAASPTASPSPTATPTLTPAPAEPRPEDEPEPEPTRPEPSGPTEVATTTAAFRLSGQVKRLDGSPDGLPLPGVTVRLHRFDAMPHCGPGAVGLSPPAYATVADADGAFAFDGVAAGIYVMGAARATGAASDCLPEVWYMPAAPAVQSFCAGAASAFVLDPAVPGREWSSLNILYAADVGCFAYP